MVPVAVLPSFRGWDLICITTVCFLIFGNQLPSVIRALRESISGPRPPCQP